MVTLTFTRASVLQSDFSEQCFHRVRVPIVSLYSLSILCDQISGLGDIGFLTFSLFPSTLVYKLQMTRSLKLRILQDRVTYGIDERTVERIDEQSTMTIWRFLRGRLHNNSSEPG